MNSDDQFGIVHWIDTTRLTSIKIIRGRTSRCFPNFSPTHATNTIDRIKKTAKNKSMFPIISPTTHATNTKRRRRPINKKNCNINNNTYLLEALTKLKINKNIENKNKLLAIQTPCRHHGIHLFLDTQSSRRRRDRRYRQTRRPDAIGSRRYNSRCGDTIQREIDGFVEAQGRRRQKEKGK